MDTFVALALLLLVHCSDYIGGDDMPLQTNRYLSTKASQITEHDKQIRLSRTAAIEQQRFESTLMASLTNLLSFWGRTNVFIMVDVCSTPLREDTILSYLKRNSILAIIKKVECTQDPLSAYFPKLHNVFISFNSSKINTFLSTVDLSANKISWLLLVDELPDSSTIKGKLNTQLNFIKFQSKNQSSQALRIVNVFFNHHTKKIEFHRIGEFHPEAGLKFYKNFKLIDDIHRLRGLTLQALTFHNPPFVFVDFSQQPPIITGLLPDILKILESNCNIKANLTAISDNTFGTEVSPGVITGLVGRIARREGDIGLNTLSMTRNRILFIHFFGPVTRGDMSIFIKRQSYHEANNYQAFSLPFEQNLWLIIILMFITSSIFLIIITGLGQSFVTTETSDHTSNFKWETIYKNAFINPTSVSGKIALGTVLLSTIILFQHYSSVLVSFSTYHDNGPTMKTIQDVANNKDYKIAIVKETNINELFERSRDKVYVQIWLRIVANRHESLVPEAKDGLNLIGKNTADHKFVFLHNGLLTKYLNTHHADIAALKESYVKDYEYMGVRKDFPYKAILANRFHRMQETGLINQLFWKYLILVQPLNTHEAASTSISFRDVKLLFFFLFLAVVTAVMALSVEIMLGKLNKIQNGNPFYTQGSF